MNTRPLQISNVEIIFIEEKDSIIAYCPALDLSSCGETVEEAEAMLKEATGAFFESCIEREVLDDVLEELGWQRCNSENQSESWMPPHIINATKEMAINI